MAALVLIALFFSLISSGQYSSAVYHTQGQGSCDSAGNATASTGTGTSLSCDYASSPRNAATNTAISDVQTFNVSNVLAEIRLKPATAHGNQNVQSLMTNRLDAVHKDRLFFQRDSSHDYNKYFEARVGRDIKRVNALLRKVGQYQQYVAMDLIATHLFPGEELGIAEYVVRIGVGTPPTSQYMVIDTGSDITWIQCQPCDKCYSQVDPIFDPTSSQSYASVPCQSLLCNLLLGSGCRAGQCPYKYSYGDASHIEGTLSLETVSVGMMRARIAIGCGHRNHGTLSAVSGILALGDGPLSFLGQLAGQTGGLFSYCLGTVLAVSPGYLEFGREAIPEGAAWVPLIRNLQYGPYYYVDLLGVGVGGQPLAISESVFRGKVILDSGTAVSRFLAKAYNALRDAFSAETSNIPRAPAWSTFDTCYDLSGSASIIVPTISFYFSGGTILSLAAKNFLVPVNNEGTFCFAFATPTKFVDPGISIIGNMQQEGIQITIDAANGAVGFGPNYC